MEYKRNDRLILCVVGARPNFMKIAPIMRALRHPENDLQAMLLHTGQHYDEAMKHSFFEQLDIPEPEIDLEVGSGSHAQQTAEIMKRFEPVLDEQLPAAVLVVGDVNSTIACALVAVKKQVPVIHVEAGLRSGDRAMPEEINRILTDQLSDLLFTTEESAQANLEAEGIDPARIHFVGNVMIDTLLHNLERCTPVAETLRSQCDSESDTKDLIVSGQPYGLMTLHRPANVDDPAVLARLLGVLREISLELPLVFPVHPRTKQCIERAGQQEVLDAANIVTMPPLGYLEMLGLMKGAKLVLTDSGGIQEETTALGVPCITLRENTERPITVDQGTNTIVGSDPALVRKAFDDVMSKASKTVRKPKYWDGDAAPRIVSAISSWLDSRG